MKKPDNLREHLTSAIPELKQNPEKLLVFADQGHIVASGTASLSFEYQYKLNLILTDYSGQPETVMVPLLAWVATNQPDLMGNPELRQTGIGFEVDFNNHTTVDLSITLQLTERTIVNSHAGQWQILSPAEGETPA